MHLKQPSPSSGDARAPPGKSLPTPIAAQDIHHRRDQLFFQKRIFPPSPAPPSRVQSALRPTRPARPGRWAPHPQISRGKPNWVRSYLTFLNHFFFFKPSQGFVFPWHSPTEPLTRRRGSRASVCARPRDLRGHSVPLSSAGSPLSHAGKDEGGILGFCLVKAFFFFLF